MGKLNNNKKKKNEKCMHASGTLPLNSEVVVVSSTGVVIRIGGGILGSVVVTLLSKASLGTHRTTPIHMPFLHLN